MTQSSYLMSFIRNLMENSSKDVREKKKKQLETDFTETGSVLDTCLVEKFDEVTKVLNVYNAVSTRVSANISAVNKIKRDLVECKTLLYCNREELRRLWIELVEQRACIELLDTLSLVQSAPDAISTLVNARAWSEATELILHTSELLNSDIAVIPALVSIKTNLAHNHKFIADHLKKQLLSVLYDRPISLVLEKHFKRPSTPKTGLKQLESSLNQKSTCFLAPSHFASLPLASWSTADISPPVADSNLHKDPLIAAQSIAANISSRFDQDASKAKSSDDYSDHEWMRELVAVVHCLARLDKLPQILASWAPQSHLSQLQHSVSGSHQPIFSAPLVPGQGLLGELHRFIVLKAVNAVESEAIAQGDKELLCNFPTPKYLTMLLHLIFNALFMQARACLLVIHTMKTATPIIGKSIRDMDNLTNDYVWSCIQQEVQLILSIHLEKRALGEKPMESTYSSNAAEVSNRIDASKLDLNSLLGRKRPAPFVFAAAAATTPFSASFGSLIKPEGGLSSNGTSLSSGGDFKSPSTELFSFTNTSHALSISSYMRENRILTGSDASTATEETSAGDTVYPLVCRPDEANILNIYGMVLEFVDAIEREMTISCSEARLDNHTSPAVRRCSQLRLYVKNFVENTFLPNASNKLRLQLQRSLSVSGALTSIISQQIERELGLQRPILSAVHSVDQCLLQLRQMMIALPEYADECLTIGADLLNEFIAAIWRVYRNLGEADSSGNTVPSSDWSQDDDVSRFWKKFPVWQRMAAHEARLLASNTLLTPHRDGTPVDSITLPVVDNSPHLSTEAMLSTPTHMESRISTATAVALGLHGEYEGAVLTDPQSLARLVIPFATGRNECVDLFVANGGEYSNVNGLLCEREATRLAAKEAKQLLHMIKDEIPKNLPSDPSTAVIRLPTIRNIQHLKILGRLSESLCWLSRRVFALDTWIQRLRRRPEALNSGSSLERQSLLNRASPSSMLSTPLSACANELTRLSDACLLMTYLEVRIQAYNHFGGLPPNVTYWCPTDDIDVDKYVTDFLTYLEQVQDMLMHTFSRHKFRFIFDGLGDFISQLLLWLIPKIPRMNANGNRKMCRNVYRLQQVLTSLTESHESDLIRVKQLFELFNLTPEMVVNQLLEQGVSFDEKVYSNLFQLYQRSHPTHAYAKTEESIAKLSTVINRFIA